MVSLLLLLCLLFQHPGTFAEMNSLRIRKNGLLLQELPLSTFTTNPSLSNPYSSLTTATPSSSSSSNPTTFSTSYSLTPTPSPTPEPTSSTSPSASPHPTYLASWSPDSPSSVTPTPFKRDIPLPPSSHQEKSYLLKSALRKPVK